MAKRPGEGQDPLFDVPDATVQTDTAGGTRRRGKPSGSRGTTPTRAGSGSGGHPGSRGIPLPNEIFRVRIESSAPNALRGAWDQTGSGGGGGGAGAPATPLDPAVAAFDTILTKQEAVTEAATQMVQQMATMLTQQALYAQNADNLLAASANAQVDTFQQTAALAGQIIQNLQKVAPTPGPDGTPVSYGGGGGGGRGPGGRVHLDSQGMGAFGRGGVSLGNLRDQINFQMGASQPGSFSRLGQQATLRGAVAYDERIAGRIDGYEFETDRNGKPISVRRAPLPDGHFGPALPEPDEEEQASLLRTATRGYATARMTQGFLQGGARGALRAAPGVGIGIMAAEALYAGGNQVAEQRARNAEFQSIYGGTNMEGFGERYLGGVHRAHQWGVMGGEQADALFSGVSQIGIQGQDRANALDFATGQYRERGMDIEDSVALIQTAYEAGNTSLLGLAESLDTVSKAARRSGMNVAQATRAFNQNYQQISQVMAGAGGGSATIAAAMTAQTLSGGRATSTLNSGSATQGNNLWLAASLAGTTPGALLAEGQTNPAAVTQATDRTMGLAADIVLTDDVMAAVAPLYQRYVDQNGGEPPTDEQLQIIAREAQRVGGVAPETAAQIMGQFGHDVSPAQAYAALLNQEFGNTATAQIAEVEEGEAVRNISSRDIDAARGETTTGFFEATLVPHNRRENDSEVRRRLALEGAGGHTSTLSSHFVPWGQDDARNDAIGAYQDYVDQESKANPALESLLASEQFSDDQKFVVQVAGEGGKPVEREVGYEDLIRHFGDQAARGSVKFADTGETFSEAGLATDQSLQNKEITDFYSYNQEKNRERGDDVDKKKPRDGGKYVVEPSEELRRWIRIMDSSGYETSEPYTAAATGAPTRAPRPPG